MSLEKIVCPKCSHQFPPSLAFSREIKEINERAQKKIQELMSTVSQKELELKATIAGKDQELELARAKLKSERELLDLKEQELEQRASQRALEIARSREPEIRKRVKKDLEVEMASNTEALREKEIKLSEYRSQLASALAEKRQLEVEKQEMELELQRRLNSELKRAQDEAAARTHESYALKMAEKDKQINDMSLKLTEALRRAEQKSQQAQGEILEVELEQQLRSAFKDDEIEEVAKGVSGADILQTVFGNHGPCGQIIWETKNTKNWSNEWISKLKEDQRKRNASVAVLVTQSFPRGSGRFMEQNGVYVCDFHTATLVGSFLRKAIIDVDAASTRAQGKASKMEEVFRYLTGTRFKQRIEAIIEAFQCITEQTERERTYMTRAWRVRDTQIEIVKRNTVEMYGDLEGIVGKQLPPVPAFELDSHGGTVDPAPHDVF